MAVDLTDIICRQAVVPAAGQRTTLCDAKVTGLMLRVTASGARTWSVEYKTPDDARKRYTIGTYRPAESKANGYTLAEARRIAATVLHDVAEGKAPTHRVKGATSVTSPDGLTVRTLAESWLVSRAARAWRPMTAREFTREMRAEVIPVLGDLHPERVTKANIRDLYDGIEQRSRSVAQHTYAMLRVFYRWAAEEDHISVMPIFPYRDTQSIPRERVFTEEEIRIIVTTLDNGITPMPKGGHVDAMAEAIRLMLLTGQRQGEVLSMEWSEIDDLWWTIPGSKHKSKKPHRVPLTKLAVASLKTLHRVTGGTRWVFPSPKKNAKAGHVRNPQKAAERLWEATGIEGATLHDLRRSCATFLTGVLGVGTPVVGKILGHAAKTVTGRVYDKHLYDAEKRKALDLWSAEVTRIMTTKAKAKGPKRKAAKALPWSR